MYGSQYVLIELLYPKNRYLNNKNNQTGGKLRVDKFMWIYVEEYVLGFMYMLTPSKTGGKIIPHMVFCVSSLSSM